MNPQRHFHNSSLPFLVRTWAGGVVLRLIFSICLGSFVSCGLWPGRAGYETAQYEEGDISRMNRGQGSGSGSDGGVLPLRPEIGRSVLGSISGISIDSSSPADSGFIGEGAAEWTLPPGSSPIVLSRKFEPILFDYNSARIDFPARRMLRDVARWLVENPQAHLTLEGHCDPKGSSEYNLNLGHSRAFSARQGLEHLGVDLTRLHTISYGEERPRVQGQAPEADRLNRRVEFRLHSKPLAAAADRPDQSGVLPPQRQPQPRASGIDITPSNQVISPEQAAQPDAAAMAKKAGQPVSAATGAH